MCVRTMMAYVISRFVYYMKQKGFDDSTPIDYVNSVLTDSVEITFAIRSILQYNYLLRTTRYIIILRI